MNRFAFRATVAMLWLAALHLTIWPHIVPVGGQTVGGSFTVLDTIPPAPVTDLCVINPEENSLTLTWTAPGDDGNQGTATQYDIRYSASPITTETEWSAANQTSNIPSPQSAGSSEILIVTDSIPSTGCFFALKTSDEIPNWSGLSNCASVISSENSIGWAAPRLMLNLDGQVTSWLIQPNGTLLEDVYAINRSGDIIIRIPTGAQILNASMNPQSSIGLTRTATVPAPPDNYDVIAAFDLGPKGSTANPGIEICIFYSDDMLVQGTDETNLAIALFDDSNGEWSLLNSVTDLDANTITFSTSRLYTFAVLAPSTIAPGPTGKPSPTPQPSTPTIATPTPQPSATPATPDLHLDLSDTDFVGTKAGEQPTSSETASYWGAIVWICVLIFLCIIAIAILLLKRRCRKRGQVPN